MLIVNGKIPIQTKAMQGDVGVASVAAAMPSRVEVTDTHTTVVRRLLISYQQFLCICIN